MTVPNCALRQKINNNSSMFGVSANFIAAEMETIRLYLINVRDAVVNTASTSFADTQVGSTGSASFTITIDNYRRTSLDKALSISSTVSNEFTINSQSSSPGCSGGSVAAAASVSSPTTCTISATVKFQPSAPGTRTGNLRLTLTPPSGDPTPPVRDIALSAVAPQPIVAQAIIVSPATNALTGTSLTISGATSTPVGGVTYQWAVRNPAGVTTQLGTNPTQSVPFTAVGTYRVTLTVLPSGGGTPSSTFVDIAVTAPIVAQAIIVSPATSALTGSSLTISGATSTPVGGVSYQWAVRDPANVTTQLGTSPTQSVPFTAVGTYRVTLTVQPSGGGTPSSAFVDITVTAPPVLTEAKISSPASGVVAGASLTISGAASTPLNGVTYQWAVRDPANVTTQAGTAATQSVQFTTVGTYRITLTVQPTGGGAASSAFVDIAVSAIPPVIATAIVTSPATSVVAGTTLTISGMSSIPLNAVTYQWAVRDPANVTTQAGTAATQSVLFTTVGSYRITLTVQPSAGGAQSSAFVDIAVTAPPVVPAPVFSASGFDALAHFSASTAASQTLCPTIQNSGTANLSLSFSAVQAAGSSANFANYFELGDNASCPSTLRACNTSMPAGSPISGSTELQAPADSACTLALRFNPAKFGDAGGLGARTATLRIAHNAPAGTVFDAPMIGNVTPRPLPSIGLSTNPTPSPLTGRVLPPAFATQLLNTTSALWNEFQVFNSGDTDGLDLTEVANSNPQDFSLTENCVSAPPLARLNNGTESKCVIGLRFTPKALGERCTTITVRAAESSNGAQSLAVCGTAVAVPGPDVTLSSQSIDFGRRFISAAYPPKELVISNGAGATAFLQINAVTVTGAGFALVPNAGTSQAPCAGASLAPGASCTVQVQFAPDPTRPETTYSASLQIDTNDATTPRRTVSLAGVAGPVATPPVLQFPDTPAQIAFAAVVVAGQQSEQALTVTLRNAGPGNASIDAIRMVGADASSFSASGCPASLEQGNSCVISVRFVPGSGGLKRAQLEILASRSISPSLVTVTGRGVGGTSAFLTASAAGLSLGSVRVGAQSAPVEVRLASAGDGVVQVTGLQAGGPFTVQSKTCPSLPFTLPRGADCTVTVTFAPTDARAATAILRISTDSDPKALEVPLTGNGQEGANVSSGGCSMASGDTLVDPTLWALVLLAIGALIYRHRGRAAPRRRP
ncbi:choice-of-anchor D domain-containing protein [Caballeronia mineralivorans]|uniref:choice-of-anchor D domain-containing protein n=1 Tax=Caballeronia mineralivorans TaxID=2010198 RepID=UPI0023F00A21|nr:choice-of-anchor D domain-containing protein [Caballeronia mineralivorans]